jgi:hypothetical protein
MQGRLKELFPRDRRMQELFFHEFRTRGPADEEETTQPTPAEPPTV